MVQVNSTYVTLRVKFVKRGSLQYISHLDLVRTMNKIIVRAGLPLWYTEGFNPKPKMVFAAPLSIGTESLCEYMDIRLTHRLPTEEVKERLNKNMTEEMQVTEAYYPETKLTELKWLAYTVTLKTNGASEALAEKCVNALLAPSVTVAKKMPDKKGEPVYIDIRPLIKSAEASFDGELITLELVLSADASAFLNPEYVIKALRISTGILTDPCLINEYYTILRTRAYNENMLEFR